MKKEGEIMFFNIFFAAEAKRESKGGSTEKEIPHGAVLLHAGLRRAAGPQ